MRKASKMQAVLERAIEAITTHRTRRPPRIAVVGSVNLDFIAGITQMPERGETVTSDSLRVLPGGKGANQATQAALLGAEVSMVGRVGSTVLAQMALAGLEHAGVDLTHVSRDTELETGLAFVFVEDTGDNRIVVVPRANGALTAQHVQAASETIAAADVLLLQLEVPDDAITAAVQIASEADCKIILNPAPARPLSAEMLTRVDYLIPNETETATLSEMPVTDRSATIAAARKLTGAGLDDSGATNVIVTLGEQGAMAISRNQPDPVFVEAVPLDQISGAHVIDPTGAGDAFCGAFGVGIAIGLDLADSLALGSIAGAYAVTSTGAQASMGTLTELTQWI